MLQTCQTLISIRHHSDFCSALPPSLQSHPLSSSAHISKAFHLLPTTSQACPSQLFSCSCFDFLTQATPSSNVFFSTAWRFSCDSWWWSKFALHDWRLLLLPLPRDYCKASGIALPVTVRCCQHSWLPAYLLALDSQALAPIPCGSGAQGIAGNYQPLVYCWEFWHAPSTFAISLSCSFPLSSFFPCTFSLLLSTTKHFPLASLVFAASAL